MSKRIVQQNWKNNVYARDFIREFLADIERQANTALQGAMKSDKVDDEAWREGQFAWWQAVRRVVRWQLSQIDMPRVS